MRMVAEYLEHARHFERLAGETYNHPALRAELIEQAKVYRRLARERAAVLGDPLPSDGDDPWSD